MGNGEFEWVKLELTLSVFESSRFLAKIRQVEESGVQITTLTGLGDTPGQRRKLYELNAVCSADIPGRGEFYTWEEYQEVRLGASSFLPEGVVLALDGEDWVGMSGISHRQGFDYAFAEMTGTVRSHRGRGIATALKVVGIDFARSLGVASIRTVHHPNNRRMIALNRQLGFVDEDWDYPIR